MRILAIFFCFLLNELKNVCDNVTKDIGENKQKPYIYIVEIIQSVKRI